MNHIVLSSEKCIKFEKRTKHETYIYFELLKKFGFFWVSTYVLDSRLFVCGLLASLGLGEEAGDRADIRRLEGLGEDADTRRLGFRYCTGDIDLENEFKKKWIMWFNVRKQKGKEGYVYISGPMATLPFYKAIKTQTFEISKIRFIWRHFM